MTHDRPRLSRPWAASGWVTPAVVALAVCFQIQTDLAIGKNVIRVSASDLLSPLLAIFILIDIHRKGLNRPSWRVLRLWLWLGAVAVLAGASLSTGAMYQRHVWFLLGWALALPAAGKNAAAQDKATA